MCNKKVNFNNIVKVILIPERIEYNNFKNLLWWDNNDYKKSLQLSIIELNVVINCNPSFTYKDTKKHLYQPKYNTIINV